MPNAIISVHNKTNPELPRLISTLANQGVILYASGGTYDYIKTMGIDCRSISTDITGFPEILDGRVKTLHPHVFGGILFRRDSENHLDQIASHGIVPIDMVVVDLYPFESAMETGDHDNIIENIDIGGVSLIRAAAKNYRDVAVIANRSDYSQVSDILTNSGWNGLDLETRRSLALKAFQTTCRYDALISDWFNQIRSKI